MNHPDKKELSPLRTAGRGFIYGAGVSGGILAIVVVSLFLSIRTGDSGIQTIDNLPFELRASDTKPVMNPRSINISVVGKLTNTGTVPSTPVDVEVDLKDNNGEFIFQCSEHYRRKINPGRSEPFQVNCFSVSQEIYDSFDHFEIHVVR